MRPTDLFSLVPDPAKSGVSSLWGQGRKLNEQVPGVSLEAQYAVGRNEDGPYLLLTTYDVPHEETLHVMLVDASGRIMESKSLGAPYAPGILKELRVTDHDALFFNFQGPVLLTVHPAPRGLLRRRIQLQRLKPERQP